MMKIKKRTRIRVATIQCPSCKDIIYSRTVHDYRTCICGRTSIDGGFDYCHVGYDPIYEPPKIKVRYINITKSQLYKDWNCQIDKYGIIKGK